ncbi:LacI family DNA-binding transcriptional regulator [Lysobacter korlensis]|uniref:LacI family DNA-binding transcriptional regulator n=1 Tax=Lysobacter korlensis TaxID=553636 RepID=A0ABV6RRI5_9GAMM
MVTIVDVAQLAGVSTSTVSHVLNGTRNVEPATRGRVLDAIEKTGYRQDALARALRRSRTDSIGLVVSDAGEPAFAGMVHGVEQGAVDHDLTLVLANSAEDPAREMRAVRALLERRVDGLIIARCAESSPALTRYLDDAATPVVLLDRLADNSPFDQVGADNRESMRRLATHLHSSGHRRIAVLAGDTRVPTLRERLEGFFDAMPSEGLRDQAILEGHDDAELRSALIGHLRGGAYTCVIACSTPLAVTALESMRDAGLRVPEDLAFATYDGFTHSDLFSPTITTVRQPAFEMGTAAVKLLIDRSASPQSSPRTMRLRQTVELRTSTEEHRIQVG